MMGWAAPLSQARPAARRLVWIGVLFALVGAGLAVGVVTVEWTLSGTVTAGTPEAALYEALLDTYSASGAVIGIGIFLAALGFALRGPQRNNWFLLGGVLVLVGAVGAAALQVYIQSWFSQGVFPGFDAIRNLSMAESILGLLDPLGIALILLGFVLPRGTAWMG